MKVISKFKLKGLAINLFQIPIYDSKVCFIKYEENTYDKAMKYLKGIGVVTESYETDEFKLAYGFVSKEKTKHGTVNFIFLNNSKEYRTEYSNTLAHETYHLVNNICKNHGIIFELESDNEPHAYLTGYLFQLLSSL